MIQNNIQNQITSYQSILDRGTIGDPIIAGQQNPLTQDQIDYINGKLTDLVGQLQDQITTLQATLATTNSAISANLISGKTLSANQKM